MNETIDTILNHRSIRKFTKQPLSDEQINTIIEAAHSASTSSYMMAYSIIGVTDLEKKSQLAEITNQPYVKENGHLLLFCADLRRNTLSADNQAYEQMKTNLENTEHLLVATIDAALAAQNAAIAAESMGLGICYIGSIRNNIHKVDELFHLPNHVIALFGLAIGFPAHEPDQKPRLPQKAVYFNDNYMEDEEMKSSIQQFDRTIEAYYQQRSTNQRLDSWSNQMIRKFSTPKRLDVTDYVKKKGFNKK
ncbi:oxygen-insensitive NADPH nitroreductase [Aquibacillus albus]|uniref:FMN reductase (NADPH) n=1 Tax=Aquibacillus albus TaxID=1168171 RepID=A0ABS2N271_9BACI|nr:oxygen-insensitive NADPH nitroreductase [Aquibacillus albus]MBM7572193.1 FMN reductase (NADPH) [Aquibacillus albus]